MSFSYTANLQNAIAYAVWNVAYSSLTAAQKAQMDGTAAPAVAWNGTNLGGAAGLAATEAGNVAQWYEQISAASLPTPAWDRLFVAKAVMMLSQTARPDRYSVFKAEHETALDETLDTFTRDLISSTSVAGQGITLAGIRAYVIDHCVKRANSATGLRRRLFPTMAQIDGAFQWVAGYVSNLKPWHFRKRQVILRIESVSFSGATFIDGTKSLVATGAFSNMRIGSGNRVIITGGTNAALGEYAVSSRTDSNTLVLERSIADTQDDLEDGDITGFLQIVTINGMNTGETFDAVVSRRFYYDDEDAGCKLEWADSSDMARSKASAGSTTGTPSRFRWEKYGTGFTWHLSPFPDGDYRLRGAVSIAGPGALTTSASLDTLIARFPDEFGPILRDMTLAKVLQAHGASDGDMMFKQAIEQCDTLLPAYADQGFPTRQTSMEDVYNDYGAMLDGGSSAYGH